MQIQGSALLLQGAHNSNYLRVPATILSLPKRRPHSQRDHAQQIATLMFPDYTLEKALITYESQRKQAVATYRAKVAADLERKRQLQEESRPDREHQPWDPAKDPLEVPKAAPMPVTVGTKEDFKDCFAFLRSDAGGRVEAMLNMPDASSTAPSMGLIRGEEPGHKTRLLEFKRGVVYEDGRLDLCKMVVGPDHIDELMDSLDHNTHIHHFLLGNNVITNHGARRIAKFVRDHPERMETWYLAGNHIKPAGFHELAGALAGSEVLTNLWLKRNPLGPSCVNDIVTILTTAKHLRVLDVETCELGDEGVASLFHGLTKAKPTNLEAIYLNGNGAGPAGAAAIGDFLASPGCSLKYLMLSSNPLGDIGAKVLASGLADNTTLEVVTLASCGFSSRGIAAICQSLTHHPNIRHMDFGSRFNTADLGQRFNHLADDDPQALSADHAVASLCKMIKNTPYLRFLELGYVALSEQGLEQLRDAVAAEESTLVGFEALRIIPETERTARGGGISCSLRVRRALEENYMRFYGGNGMMAEGVSYEDFVSKSGMSRLLRNTPDVRLIDSVYRTRDKGKTTSGKVRKFWDLDWDGQDRQVWERLDAIE